MIEREPLHSLEMEMATLGSAMLGDDTAKAIRGILPKPRMFYRPAHQDIWASCLFLMDKGLPVDMQFVCENLGARIEELGGEDYLIQIADYVPSPSSGEYYARVVLDYWTRREYVKLGNLVKADSSPDELHIIADGIKAGAVIGSASPVVATMGTLDSREKRGLSTGWAAIDELTSCGGWPTKQFGIVRAKTGVGKTPFLTQACIEAAKRGRKPLYATFADLSQDELQERMMKYLTGWSHQPSKSDCKAADWADAKQELRGLGIDVYDATSMESGSDIETFCLWFDRHKEERGYTEVYADYLQEIRTRTRMDRMERQCEVATQFKSLMKRHDIAGLMGAQVSNNLQEGDMSKGGRDADDKAALIIDIKPNESGETGEIRIAKNRVGSVASLGYTFDKRYLKFEVSA